MGLPLEGVLVVALEQAVAAPYCSSRLADAGARVIKVERREGDFARDYDHVANGESAFGAVNAVSDLVEHAQLRRQSVDTPSGAVELVAPPARSSGPARHWRGVPAVGQHSSEIRREFSAGGSARGDREAPVGGA